MIFVLCHIKPRISYPYFWCGTIFLFTIKYNFLHSHSLNGLGQSLVWDWAEALLVSIFTFVASTLSLYRLLRLSPFSVRGWAELDETYFFYSYVGRARLFGGAYASFSFPPPPITITNYQVKYQVPNSYPRFTVVSVLSLELTILF